MELKVLHTFFFSITIILFSSFTTCSFSEYQTLSWPGPEVISDESESATSLSLELSHIDDLYPSLDASPYDLFNLRLQRDALRVESLISRASGNHKRSQRGFSGRVVSGFPQGVGEYFMRLGIGTPAKYIYMALDTGSDIIWLQCRPCQYCYNQSDPIFDPSKSKSYAAVPCGSPTCHKIGSYCFKTHNKTCFYQVHYMDYSITNGDFSTETFSFDHRASVDHIAFGCGHVNTGHFNGSAGLIGLGRGEFSFPSQTKNLYNGKFSYCFPNRFGDNSSSKSTIVFGDKAIPKNAIFTPLISNPKMAKYYYVQLLGISIDGSRVRGITESDFKIDPVTGDGGLIIDSGTTVTQLKRSVYVAFRDAFRRKMSNVKRVRFKSPFETCYDFDAVAKIKVPKVVFHFAGGDVSLATRNYLAAMSVKGPYCFAFGSSGGNLSIYGNMQQHSFRIAYDSIGSRIGFLPNAC